MVRRLLLHCHRLSFPSTDHTWTSSTLPRSPSHKGKKKKKRSIPSFSFGRAFRVQIHRHYQLTTTKNNNHPHTPPEHANGPISASFPSLSRAYTHAQEQKYKQQKKKERIVISTINIKKRRRGIKGGRRSTSCLLVCSLHPPLSQHTYTRMQTKTYRVGREARYAFPTEDTELHAHEEPTIAIVHSSFVRISDHIIHISI